ncbi:MAG: zf-TFIIB domain-containing protein [Planctomycetes bacterium]|nr:zf-TFIIB domain-containing protein [Planctomycetota bacterium]
MSRATRYPCPSCETVTLEKRRESGVSFVECPDCFGTFFSVNHLCHYLGERIGNREAGAEFLRLLTLALAEDKPDGQITRMCIVCKSPLQRFAFGERPLVIADRCDEHGLWLDRRDLPKVERQVRACLRIDDDEAHGGAYSGETEDSKQRAAPPDRKVVCPNCHRRYPETFLDKRCEDCNVGMFMD